MENRIILKVFIDYTHNGKNEQHEQTAAEMVVNQIESIHSIVDGVKITSVQVEQEENNGANDIVTITCYGKTEKTKRKDAINKYYEWMTSCEGSEAERYLKIYSQLIDGQMVCSDK